MIEAMSEFLPVPDYFGRVYLVDLTPSLLEIARQRFARLGWKNVEIICEDARRFCTKRHVSRSGEGTGKTRNGALQADLITMSYSLTVIPDALPLIDSLVPLLSPSGVIGVADFYVENIVDVAGRNYTAGSVRRHLGAFTRMFWKAWFEIDQITLEAARREYLEYRFGSIFNVNCWKYEYRLIPYFIWIGCSKRIDLLSVDPGTLPNVELRQLQEIARATDQFKEERVHSGVDLKVPSNFYETALINIAEDLPLPSFFYQNKHWRLPNDENLEKVAGLSEISSPYTWDEAQNDKAVMSMSTNDTVLALTNGGDNILAYALDHPKHLHAVDPNPAQNHVLELKVASFAALDHSQMPAFFGTKDSAAFCKTLIAKVSPYLSSHALQFWLHHTGVHGKRFLEFGSPNSAIIARYFSVR